jgi:hypothetical protein
MTPLGAGRVACLALRLSGLAGAGILVGMGTGRHRVRGLCAAVDVHYLRSGGARAAVLRGTSARPLFVTAAGMPRADAAELVRHMAGRFRVPDALRRADQLARTTQPADTQASHHPS